MTTARTRRRTIGETLVDEGLISRDDLEEALRIQRRSAETLAAILVDMECCRDADITKAICVHYQIPYIRLANYDVDTKLVGLFPKEFLHQHKLFPFDRMGDMLLCVVAEIPPDDILAEIPRLTRLKAALYAGTLSEVDEYLERHCPFAEGERPSKVPAGKQEEPALAGIFDEESSEALLQALDSTWDSIFDSVEEGKPRSKRQEG